MTSILQKEEDQQRDGDAGEAYEERKRRNRLQLAAVVLLRWVTEQLFLSPFQEQQHEQQAQSTAASQTNTRTTTAAGTSSRDQYDTTTTGASSTTAPGGNGAPRVTQRGFLNNQDSDMNYDDSDLWRTLRDLDIAEPLVKPFIVAYKRILQTFPPSHSTAFWVSLTSKCPVSLVLLILLSGSCITASLTSLLPLFYVSTWWEVDDGRPPSWFFCANQGWCLLFPLATLEVFRVRQWILSCFTTAKLRRQRQQEQQQRWDTLEEQGGDQEGPVIIQLFGWQLQVPSNQQLPLQKEDPMILLLCYEDSLQTLPTPLILQIWWKAVDNVLPALEMGLTATRCVETTTAAVDLHNNVQVLAHGIRDGGWMHGFELILQEMILLTCLTAMGPENDFIDDSDNDDAPVDPIGDTHRRTLRYIPAISAVFQSSRRMSQNLWALSVASTAGNNSAHDDERRLFFVLQAVQNFVGATARRCWWYEHHGEEYQNPNQEPADETLLEAEEHEEGRQQKQIAMTMSSKGLWEEESRENMEQQDNATARYTLQERGENSETMVGGPAVVADGVLRQRQGHFTQNDARMQGQKRELQIPRQGQQQDAETYNSNDDNDVDNNEDRRKLVWGIATVGLVALGGAVAMTASQKNNNRRRKSTDNPA